MFTNALGHASDFADKRTTETRTFQLVVLSGVVQFSFGQLVEGDVHLLQPAPSLLDDSFGWSAGLWVAIPGMVTSLGFFSPESLVLLLRQML